MSPICFTRKRWSNSSNSLETNRTPPGFYRGLNLMVFIDDTDIENEWLGSSNGIMISLILCELKDLINEKDHHMAWIVKWDHEKSHFV